MKIGSGLRGKQLLQLYSAKYLLIGATILLVLAAVFFVSGQQTALIVELVLALILGGSIMLLILALKETESSDSG